MHASVTGCQGHLSSVSDSERLPIILNAILRGRIETWLSAVLKIKDSSPYNSISCSDYCEDLNDRVQETSCQQRKKEILTRLLMLFLKYYPFSRLKWFDWKDLVLKWSQRAGWESVIIGQALLKHGHNPYITKPSSLPTLSYKHSTCYNMKYFLIWCMVVSGR